jgi:hypothetical protein
MSRKFLPTAAVLLSCLLLPAAALSEQPAGQPGGAMLASLGDQDKPADPAAEQMPLYLDKELAKEHELFSSFAHTQVERMNATIIGGRHHMQIHRGSDGLFHATYRAIDMPGLVCQVRRSPSNPLFYVGSLLYKEQVLESVGKSAEACRKGPFVTVSEKSNRLIYTSNRGGGWR